MSEPEHDSSGDNGQNGQKKKEKCPPSFPLFLSPLNPLSITPYYPPEKRKKRQHQRAREKGGGIVAMNKQKELFCAEYVASHNATEAAEKAGYSKKTAYSQGHRLLKSAEIRARIAELEKDAYEAIGVTTEKVAREIARIAFADATAYAQVEDTEEGQIVHLTPTKDLTPDQRAAVSCIKQTKFGIEVQTYDKTKALELLGRYLAMFTDKTELSGGVSLTMESYLEDLDKQGEGQAF